MQNCTHNKIYDRAADGRHFKTYFDQEVIKIKYTGMSVRYQTAGLRQKRRTCAEYFAPIVPSFLFLRCALRSCQSYASG